MTTQTSNARGEVVTRAMAEAGWATGTLLGDTRVIQDLTAAYLAMRSAAPPPAAARGGVRGLVAKWRTRVPDDAGDSARVLMREHCADELESALATEGVQAGEVEQQPEARDVVDVEAIRRACQSGKRFWQAGPGYYEEIESLLPALTGERNG